MLVVRIYFIQYFIERGPCRSEREMELDSLVGEPRLKKTGDQKTPRGIYHSQTRRRGKPVCLACRRCPWREEHGKPTCRRERLPSPGETRSRWPARPRMGSRAAQLRSNSGQLLWRHRWPRNPWPSWGWSGGDSNTLADEPRRTCCEGRKTHNSRGVGGNCYRWGGKSSARKAAYLALLADTRARHHARLAAMKQRLPSLAARLRRLWQDVGCARRPAPAKGHLSVTATVEKQLEKAEVLLRLTEDYLVPTEEMQRRNWGWRESTWRPLGHNWRLWRRHRCQPSRLLREPCTRGSRSRDIAGKASGEERRLALLLTGKAASMKSCRRRVTTRLRCKGPRRARSGAFRSGRGARRGRSEAGEDANGVLRSEVQAAQQRRMPTWRFRGTHLWNRERSEKNIWLLKGLS